MMHFQQIYNVKLLAVADGTTDTVGTLLGNLAIH